MVCFRTGLLVGFISRAGSFNVGGRVGSGVRRSGGRMLVAMNFWNALQSSVAAKREVNYAALTGLAKEASEYALRDMVPPRTSKDGYAIGVFAGGCFWGLELAFQRAPGVIDTCVGYSQGQVEKPTYEEVCAATTGHTEAVMVTYDQTQISFEKLCALFWERLGNDAVLYHQVGNDRGPQYRHGIYPTTEEQMEVARKSLSQRQEAFSRPITTEVEEADIFYPAEPYHQQYLEKGGRFGMPQSAEKGATDPIRCYG